MMRIAVVTCLLWIAPAPRAWSQDPGDAQPADIQPTTTMFAHPDNTRFWLSGQLNLIFQTHPRFTAPYTGENSMRPTFEQATSSVLTLFTGIRLTDSTDVLFDIESAD